MGRIIIPESYKSPQDRFYDEVEAMPPDELMLALYKKAKETHKDFREFLADEIRKWNPEDYIRELYDEFLKAVQAGDEKPFPNEKGAYWNEESTFEEWLYYTELVIKIRLDKLARERKERPPSFLRLARLREELGDDADQLQLSIEGVGEAPELAILDFYEEILRKSLEAINSYRRGLIKLPPEPSWGKIDNPEALAREKFLSEVSPDVIKKFVED